MIDNCSNPECAKPPALPLRDGRIFVFNTHECPPRPEHYWLCGACSETLRMEQNEQGAVVVVQKLHRILEPEEILGVA